MPQCTAPDARTLTRISASALAFLIALLLLLPAVVVADDAQSVGVDGSNAKYPVTIGSKIGDKDVNLALTGAAMRKKSVFKVYTLGSYVDDSVAIQNAKELAEKDCAKQFHLVMERDVDGQDMAEAFIDGIKMNYPADRFPDQSAALLAFMKPVNLKKGDQIWLTHIPGVGAHCRLPGDKETTIQDIPFSVAIWDIYLGQNNVGKPVKQALTSRLPIGPKH